jgi:hypothetical protein
MLSFVGQWAAKLESIDESFDFSVQQDGISFAPFAPTRPANWATQK